MREGGHRANSTVGVLIVGKGIHDSADEGKRHEQPLRKHLGKLKCKRVSEGNQKNDGVYRTAGKDRSRNAGAPCFCFFAAVSAVRLAAINMSGESSEAQSN